MRSRSRRARRHSLRRLALLVAVAWLVVTPRSAGAQESVREVLSFLVTNRSIATDDFVRDEAAARATSDAIARFLSVELATLPIASSASGFVYRFDPTLGTVSRLSDSFGAFFTERALTTGRGRASFSVGLRSAAFDRLDGRRLDDGTLVSTATILQGDAQPFDVETVTLRVQMDTITAATSYGVTDRLEVSAAVPLVRLSLSGERVDTYRGREVLQARGRASASGIGDVVARAKYNLAEFAGGSIAAGAEAKLPTGDEEQLLGAGRGSVKPRLLASVEGVRFALDGDVGFSFGGVARALDYAAGLSLVATPRLSVIGEVIGRRLSGLGNLVESARPHPTLANVETLRLTTAPGVTNHLAAVAGVKWNVAGPWLLSANVVRTLTESGLTGGWVPAVNLDYAFGR